MTAPGWYADGQGGERYWDGASWTEHTRSGPPAPPTAGAPFAAAAPPGPPAPPPPSGPGRGRLLLALGGAVLSLVVGVGVVIGIVSAIGGDDEDVDDVTSGLAEDLVDISPTDAPTIDLDLDLDGDGDTSADSGPETVAYAYFEAYAAEDCAFLDFYVEETLTSYGISPEVCLAEPEAFFDESQDGCELELGEVVTTGASGSESASATYVIDGCVDPVSAETGTIEWQVVDGEWKILDIYADDA